MKETKKKEKHRRTRGRGRGEGGERRRTIKTNKQDRTGRSGEKEYEMTNIVRRRPSRRRARRTQSRESQECTKQQAITLTRSIQLATGSG